MATRRRSTKRNPADTFLDEVLKSAARKWPMHPLAGKKPLLPNWPTAASTNQNTIIEWRKMYPKANWGIVTGERSGIFVVDVDPRHGGDESLRALEATHGPLPETVQVVTGSGGHHYYFQYPGPDILNSAGVLGPGLDIKTNGGQVVAPPSIHPDTKRSYEWNAAHHPDDVKVAAAPGWLLEAIHMGGKKRDQTTGDEKIRDGQRNSALTRLGGGMRRQGATKEEILAALLAFNASRCAPPLADDEVRRIAESLMRYSAADEPLRLTDVGNGERFAEQHRHTARYCFAWKQWLVWDEQRWKPDPGGLAMTLAKQTARTWYQIAATEPDETKRKAYSRWAMESEKAARLTALLLLAQSEPGMSIATAAMDADPWLFNVENGTLDLRTGVLRPAHRDDFITKLAPVEYRPEAARPVFERLLNRLFKKVPAVRQYLQRIFGYALTGLTTEQCFFIFYGTGSNGKSTLLRAILDLLGDYGETTRPETFLVKRNEGIPNDVAALAGARLVSCLESEQGKQLAEGLVKGLTGGDKISARKMRQEFFSFVPQFKLFIGTNHKPTIKGTDHAMWRRVRCIPFTVTIPDKKQDKGLPEKLRAEFSGILNWLIKGCLAWHRNGLGAPLEVKEATESYREESDVLGTFIDERCIENPKATCTKKYLYACYKQWCLDSGERFPLTMRTFGKAMKERGFTDTRLGDARTKGWAGIGVGV